MPWCIMGMSYFRRYRMEIDLRQRTLADPELPRGFTWVAWDEAAIDRHAHVKYESFRDELDSRIFPCLGDLFGCQRLMTEITTQSSFLPQTTWIISQVDNEGNPVTDCATIQGLRQSTRNGAVQNVGVIPQCRGLGLGRALIQKSLDGFQQSRMNKVSLEVTADNHAAVGLYHTVGFVIVRSMYRAVEESKLQAY
ncbi:MAG: N-acetyltransferase [Planctomycetota bacterium]|nr:N-acetyltransferase [Planctomycetota bacterium]MDA1214153.1 N-acetyltransferase [Planctomycetota bacterium]